MLYPPEGGYWIQIIPSVGSSHIFCQYGCTWRITYRSGCNASQNEQEGIDVFGVNWLEDSKVSGILYCNIGVMIIFIFNVYRFCSEWMIRHWLTTLLAFLLAITYSGQQLHYSLLLELIYRQYRVVSTWSQYF